MYYFYRRNCGRNWSYYKGKFRLRWSLQVSLIFFSVTQWYAEKIQAFGKKRRTTTCKSCFLFVKWSELDMNVFVLTSYCLNAKFCLDPHNFSSFFQVNRLEYKPQWPASGRDFCVIAILREIDEGVIALASEAVCALSVIFLRFIS